MQIRANRPIIATECHRLKKGDRIVNSRSGAGRSFFLFIYIVEPKWKDHHVGGIFYGLIVKQFYGVGFEEIVTVEVLYIFALCGFYSRFTGVGKSLVGFVDDDDYLEFDAIELLYRKAKEEDADMVVFPFSLDYIESGKSECSIEIADEHFTNTEFFSAIAFSKAHWGVWSYLHKRSLYANGVTFHKGLNYGEDVFLTTQLVYFSSRISVLKSKPLLHYIIRESSITNSRFNEKKARDILLYPSLVNDFLKDKPEYGSLQKALGAIRIQANNTLLSKRWFKDARTLSRESHAILKQYPDLKRIPQIKAFHKLFTLYARSGLLGRLYAQYYICKKKIK